MRITGLSASGFAVTDWCMWKYYLQSIGFEDSSGPSAILGNLAHKILEILSRASMVKHDPSSKIWDIEYLWSIVFNHYYNLYPLVTPDIKDPKLVAVAKGIKDLLSSPYTPITDKTIGAE